MRTRIHAMCNITIPPLCFMGCFDGHTSETIEIVSAKTDMIPSSNTYSYLITTNYVFKNVGVEL